MSNTIQSACIDGAPASLPPGATIIFNTIAKSCSRRPDLNRAGKIARIDAMIEAGAWTDAALALVALELPQWTLRRLCFEDGEWHCALSSHPGLPLEVDQTADGHHEVAAMAVLNALLAASNGSLGRAPEMPLGKVLNHGTPACCDNFR
jgi:hypothetical protein